MLIINFLVIFMEANLYNINRIECLSPLFTLFYSLILDKRGKCIEYHNVDPHKFIYLLIRTSEGCAYSSANLITIFFRIPRINLLDHDQCSCLIIRIPFFVLELH